MGIMDKAREASREAEAHRAALAQQSQAASEAAVGVMGRCPGRHYQTEVNKGSIRMQTWEGHLNEMYQGGYRLAHVFEQDGNTVQVYEHSFH